MQIQSSEDASAVAPPGAASIVVAPLELEVNKTQGVELL